jgi:hypothetical protein
MIGKERLGVNGPGALLRQPGDLGSELGAVGVVPEDDPALHLRTMTWCRMPAEGSGHSAEEHRGEAGGA